MKPKIALGYFALFLAVSAVRLSAQIITDFTPTLGSAGDSITITGSGFDVSDKVYFDNGQTTWVLATATVTSSSQIQATVPSGIITGPIGIRIGTGTTSCGLNGFNCSAGDYTVVGPGPYISSVSPNIGAVGDSITIYGVHFTGATSVKFNGTNAVFNPDSTGTQIFLNVPAGATTGPITVTGPGGTATSPSPFTVIGPGPYISDFSPSVGISSTTVIINGRHFTGATNVTFNGSIASFSVTADSQIRATTPTDVTTGFIRVSSPQGTFRTSTNFFVPPSITSFSPGSGQPGATVTILGQNFKGATTVMLNGVAASYSIIDNTNISVTIPGGVNSGKLRVTVPAGTAFSATNFKVKPTLSGFSPGFGSAGATVTITGANLNEGLSAVKFNGVSATFGTPSFGSVSVTAPSGTTTGPISLTTSNGTVTSANNFYYPPSITSFSPNIGSNGTQVTIIGKNFVDASSITFNGAAASFFVNNNSNITAFAPAGVTSGYLAVTTPAGTATNATPFYAPPSISNFSPTHGIVGTLVTINGNSFLGATAVKFGNSNASFTILGNTAIQATVPPGAQNGPIKVTAPAGTATSSSSFVPDYSSDIAVTLTEGPDPVTVTSNLVYSIYVQNNGPDVAPNVVVSNYLPGSVVLKGAGLSQGSFATNGNVIIANIGMLPHLSSATIALTVTPTNAGTIYDSVIAGSGYTDPAGSNNVASVSTFVQPLPLLAIRQVSPNQVRVSWPSSLSNFMLEYKSALPNNALWLTNSAVPIVTNSENVIIEPATNSRRFYRLSR